jgi:uncharacterized protein (DUF58 family)
MNPAVTTSPAAPVEAASPLTTPQLAELMALARRAATLPPWLRSIKSRQRGDYRAHLKGRGMEYVESRPYQAGDDVRALDWRLTARLGKPHTKLFREERERPVYVAVDMGPGMAFATRGVFKRVQAARVAALLAWRAVDNGDRIGGVVFNATTHHELEPARGARAAGQLFGALLTASAPGGVAARAIPRNGNETPFATALQRLRRLVKPGSLVFLVGDGRGFEPAVCSALAGLARHNDIGIVQVFDPFERELPALSRPLSLRDADGELVLPPTDHATRVAYASRARARDDAFAAFCREHRILLQSLSTQGDAYRAVRLLLGAR